MLEIEINSKIESLNNAELCTSLASSFEELVKAEIVNATISKLTITNRYTEKLTEYNSLYNLGVELTETRGMASSYQIIRLPNGSAHALINDIFVSEENILKSVFIPLIEDHQYLSVHKIASECWEWGKMTEFESNVANLLIACFGKYDSVKIVEKIDPLKKEETDIKPDQIHEAFQFKIKDAHLLYQSDKDLGKFWHSIKGILKFYFEHLIEARLYNVDISFKPDWDEHLNKIVVEIFKLADPSFLFSIDSMRPLVNDLKEFLLFSYIYIESETPLFVRITDHPKILFPDLLDTQNSLIAFIDILGFRNIIENYDANRTSRILKTLHHTMERALAMTVIPVSQIDTAHQQTLKFRQFSDCICISNPFYDNPEQFIVEFGIIATALRIYQYLMMSADFFVRGGFAIGSFFSDENMIFSGGLVKAYDLEHNEAIYPRILIHTNIAKKFDFKSQSTIISILNLQRCLLYDEDEGEGKIFLNPFEITWGIEPESRNAITAEYLATLEILQNQLEESVDFQTNLEAISSHANSFEKMSLVVIRMHIKANITKFEDDERTRAKYEWLLDLLNFVEGQPSIRKFKYLLSE